MHRVIRNLKSDLDACITFVSFLILIHANISKIFLNFKGLIKMKGYCRAKQYVTRNNFLYQMKVIPFCRINI